jgi:succinate-semialdehyde dehydrogenase/glutarate-semialdehyde dehydrogenase
MPERGDFLMPEDIKTEAKKSYVTFQPLGIVLAVMPWNFPFWQAFRFGVPAVTAGNVVLLKHASNVPQTALAIEEAFTKAGFPDTYSRRC